jgi:hypothetical protein
MLFKLELKWFLLMFSSTSHWLFFLCNFLAQFSKQTDFSQCSCYSRFNSRFEWCETFHITPNVTWVRFLSLERSWNSCKDHGLGSPTAWVQILVLSFIIAVRLWAVLTCPTFLLNTLAVPTLLYVTVAELYRHIESAHVSAAWNSIWQKLSCQ